MGKKKPSTFNKKERREFNNFMWGHVQKILNCANLAHFEMRTLQSVAPVKRVDGGEVAMHIEVNHKYMQFVLTYHDNYSSRVWKDGDYEELVKTLCHEITHIATTEAVDQLKLNYNSKAVSYYFERLTEFTSRWLYDNYKRYMKDFNIDIKTGRSESLNAFVKKNQK